MRPVPWIILLAGCATPCGGPSVLPDYQAARAAALAPPPAVATDWKPDAVLQVSRPVVAHLVRKGLVAHGDLNGVIEVDAGRLVPDLAITQASVVRSMHCPACLALDVTIEGTLTYEGALKLTVPASVHAVVEVALEAREDGNAWVVTADLAEVRQLEVSLGRRMPKMVERFVRGPVSEAVRRRLLERTEPTEVARFGDATLPAVAVRVLTPDGALRVEVRTADPTPVPLGAAIPVPGKGWTLHVQQDAVLDLARKQAFEQGVVAWQVVPEPVGLDVGEGTFDLDLRLWMIEAPGWWRDYRVSGAITKVDHDFRLQAQQVQERGQSAGAAAADPLAELGRSTILTTISESFEGSFADEVTGEGGALQLRVSVREVGGQDGVLVVKGDLLARTPPGGNR